MRRAWPALPLLLAVASITNVRAMEPVNAAKELRQLQLGQTPEKHIPGARYRVAVFSFEDPDGTGLGDALASLVERTILTESEVASLGVIRYTGSLAPESPGALSYFDKVDKLVASQDVTLSVWGRVTRARQSIVLETFVQASPRTRRESLTWRLPLPASMGGGELRASLRPYRFAVQRLELPASSVADILASAARLNRLRRGPSDTAPLAGTMQEDQVYMVMDARQGWLELQVRGAPPAWAPMPSCEGACGEFMLGARYCGDLLHYVADDRFTLNARNLTVEAKTVVEQINALRGLALSAGDGTAGCYGSGAKIHSLVARPTSTTSGANAEAMTAVATGLQDGYQAFLMGHPAPTDPTSVCESIGIDRKEALRIAFDLADAATRDPANEDILHNLEVLFRYGGDDKRADLAARLAASRR